MENKISDAERGFDVNKTLTINSLENRALLLALTDAISQIISKLEDRDHEEVKGKILKRKAEYFERLIETYAEPLSDINPKD